MREITKHVLVDSQSFERFTAVKMDGVTYAPVERVEDEHLVIATKYDTGLQMALAVQDVIIEAFTNIMPQLTTEETAELHKVLFG